MDAMSASRLFLLLGALLSEWKRVVMFGFCSLGGKGLGIDELCGGWGGVDSRGGGG